MAQNPELFAAVTGNAAHNEDPFASQPGMQPPPMPAFAVEPGTPEDLQFFNTPFAPPRAQEYMQPSPMAPHQYAQPYAQPFAQPYTQPFAQPFGPPSGPSPFVDEPLQGGPKVSVQAAGSGTRAFWKLEFWQGFFDVDGMDVLSRLFSSVNPVSIAPWLKHKRFSYFQYQAQENGPVPPLDAEEDPEEAQYRPDLYGPIWVCMTLWVVIAAVANMNRSLICSHQKECDIEEGWFQIAAGAGALISSYAGLVPFALWVLMKYKNVPVALVDTVALYGYSFTAFVLAAILCVIPLEPIRWVVVLAASASSGVWIVFNLWGVWKQHLEDKWFMLVCGGAFALHLGLGLLFKFKFFESASGYSEGGK